MAKTVVGLFDTFAEAQNVVQDLIDKGFRREDISVVANDEARGKDRAVGETHEGSKAAEGAGAGAVGGTVVGGAIGLLVGAGLLAIPGIGPVLAAGPLAAAVGTVAATAGAGALGAGIGAAAGGLIGGLVGAGVPEEQAEYYAEGVRRGGTLVAVSTDDTKAAQAAQIMERHNVIDIDRRSSEWRNSGWRGFDPNAEPIRSENRTSQTGRDQDRSHGHHDERVMPVIEEEVDISKRKVDKGGVRVNTRVEERQIDEDVNLRDERVNVERRRTDRPVSDSDRAAFKNESFEIHETHEEPVVRKRARVVEEVIIDRDVTDHTEHIHDTARRTDVDVSRTDADSFDTSAYEGDYNKHFQSTYGSSGYGYDDYRPVYNYGAQLATSNRYRNRDWNDIEPEARRSWEQENPGTWEQFKDTIRYAWDRARNRR